MTKVLKKILKVFLRYIKTGLWIAFILYGTLTPSDKLPKTRILEINYSDLVIHFSLWAILMLLLLHEMNYLKIAKESNKKNTTIALSICLGLGLFSELAQLLFIVSRTGSLFDFIADSLGSVIIFLIFRKIKKAATPDSLNT